MSTRRLAEALSRLPPVLFAAGVVFLYLPILVLAVYSFNAGRTVGVWSGFSLEHYQTLWNTVTGGDVGVGTRGEGADARSGANILSATVNSLILALLASALAAVLGTLAGWALVRGGRFWGRPLLAVLLIGPVVLPEIVLGVSVLLVFVQVEQLYGWPPRGFITVLLAHATLGMAFVAMVVRARLLGMDPSLEEAARDCGATPPEAFRTVTLPLLLPGIVSGFLLAFTLSLDDVIMTSFVTGPEFSTLPIVIFSAVRLRVTPEFNALATIMMAVVALGAITYAGFVLRAARRASAG